MKHLIVLSVLALLFAFGAQGQTAIYVGGGPSFYAPGTAAANVTVGLCSTSGGTCSLWNFEGTDVGRDLTKVKYSTASVLRQVIASTTTNSMKVDVFILGQIGANVTESAAAGSAAAGGGLTFHPAKYPNWGFTIAGKAVYSPVNPGWQPLVAAQAGYTFRGK